MADNSRVIPVADCDSEDAKPTVEEKPTEKKPIHLSLFLPPEARSPSWVIDRTKRYVENPRQYLETQLGAKTFSERLPLMHIPEEIDRDFYGTGKHKQAFETHIAKLLGKEHGLFFITGVQAQAIALKIFASRSGNNRVAWHITSHLEEAEEQAWKHLYHLDRILLGTSADENPSVEDIIQILELPEEQRPASILLEIPNRSLGCKTYTFPELEEISRACRSSNVNLHLDGARLWDIEPYYVATSQKSFSDICSLFDSVYVSFYKALGGIGGAILASNSSELISEAKIWQRRAGGNVFTLMYQVIDDERGFNENIGAFAERRRKMIEIVEKIKVETGKFRTREGELFVRFVPDVPTCCQVHVLFHGFTAEQLMSARDRVQEKSNVRVFEKLRSKVSVDEIMKREREAGGEGEEKKDSPSDEGGSKDTIHFMGWLLTVATEKIETKVFVDGYVALCEELSKLAKDAES